MHAVPRAHDRSSAFLLSHATLIVATSVLVLSQTGLDRTPGTSRLLIGLGVASSAAVFLIPRRWLEHAWVAGGVLTADTVWVTALLLASGRFESEFFYLYFFVLFLAAIGERLSLIVLGSVVVGGAYLYALSQPEAGNLYETASLIRIPFLFTVAVFYGYLVDRVRREQSRVRAEAATVRRLEEVRSHLEASNRRLQQAELAQRQANEELERVSEMKSAFVSVVSHELRTPLTSTRNAIDLVHSGRAGDLREDQKHFLEMALRNLSRLALIIDDLLDLSKVEAGRLEFRFRRARPEDVLEEARETFLPQAEERAVALELRMEEGLPDVLVDSERLGQVLSNLVGNALKFTGAQGTVTLSAGRRAGGGDDVTLEVTDTGAGIPPDELPRIFEPFHQAGDCLTRSVRGTGLGLSIARELVWAHSGEIAVDSVPGEGSTFRVHLPGDPVRAAEMVALEEELRKQRRFPFTGLLSVEWEDGRETGALDSEDCRRSVLSAVRDALRETLPRDADLVLAQPAHRRLVVLLPSTPRSGAEVVRRRLEALLEERTIRVDGVPLPPPAVLGPALFPEDGPTVRALLESIATTATAQTKNAGRPGSRPHTKGEINHEEPENPGGGRRARRGGDAPLPALAGGLRGGGGDQRAGSPRRRALFSA